jgi:hypothetical protein
MAFQAPAIGARIRVTTEWAEYLKIAAVNVQRAHTYEGIVIPSEDHDAPGTFRLHVREHYYFPRKVIPLERVIALETIEAAPETYEEPAKKWVCHTVTGSKGNIYTVTQEDDTFSCDCIAGQRGRKCKHIEEVRLKVIPRG